MMAGLNLITEVVTGSEASRYLPSDVQQLLLGAEQALAAASAWLPRSMLDLLRLQLQTQR